MKPRLSNQRTIAMTLVEVLVVIAVLAVLVVVFLPAFIPMDKPGNPRYFRINCVSNLKQIGLAYRLWEGDNNDKYPMFVSVTNGGAMEATATGNVATCFQVMSNELSTPKILVCPADDQKVAAPNFTNEFSNKNISYFVDLDVTNEINPQMLLCGDDNFEIGGIPVKSGLLEFSTNAPVSWTSARHHFEGNIGLADGSVQQFTTEGLQNEIRQTGVATNRLAIP